MPLKMLIICRRPIVAFLESVEKVVQLLEEAQIPDQYSVVFDDWYARP